MNQQVQITCEMNKPCFLAGIQTQLAYVRLDIKPQVAARPRSLPLNLAFVLDRSGSMKGRKIENVRQAVGQIIDQLGPEDILSVIAFNDEVELIVPAQPVKDQAGLKERINELTHHGGTSISKGMRVGLDELNSHLGEGHLSRMILLTDGQTYGDEDECCILAKEAASQQIAVTALGVGDEWNEEMLDAIAQNSQGKSDYIATPEEIINYFADEVTTLKESVIQNGRLTLRLTDGVQARKIYRVLPRIEDLGFAPISDRDISLEIQELSVAGQQLLIELQLPLRPEGHFRLAQAELTFDIPRENIFSVKVRSDVTFHFTKDHEQVKQYNPELMHTIERVTAFDLQTRALTELTRGNVTGATQKLRAAATRLLSLNEVDLAYTALREAENLEKAGKMTNHGTKKLRYETRKLTRRLEPVDGIF